MNSSLLNSVRIFIFSGILVFAAMSCQEKISRAKITNLKCEHLVQPLGIDSPAPRFTWQMDSDKHGLKQISYKITVGTDSAKVASGKGNVWDSRKINTQLSLAVYSGPRLNPFTKYYWSVKIWDEKNIPSKWSQPVSFETGMMEAKNWRGDWISDTRDIHLKPAP